MTERDDFRDKSPAAGWTGKGIDYLVAARHRLCRAVSWSAMSVRDIAPRELARGVA